MIALLAQLLRVVTFPHWAEHRVRTALTTIGVALGVVTVVAVADISSTILASFQEVVETVAGTSVLEVTSPAGGVDEALIDRVKATVGVADAAGIVEAFVGLPDRTDESLYVIGVDFLASSMWRTQFPRAAIEIPDELLFVGQQDSVMLGRAFADRHSLRQGDHLQVVSPGGIVTLTVRGLLGDVAPARLFDGAIGVMDLPAAQRLAHREGRIDRIAIATNPEVNLEDVRQRLVATLGTGVEIERPDTRGNQVDTLLFSLRSILVVAGSLAVIIGAFIVYHAVTLSVQQRRRQFALLNAIGVERRSLLWLCLVETGALALVGIGLGVAGGRLLAATVSGFVGAATSDIWLRVHVERSVSSTIGICVGVLVGAGMALVAAYLAARTAFAAPTVEALRPVIVEPSADRRRGSIPLGVLMVVLTWLVAFADPQHPWMVVAIVIGSQLIAYSGGALLGAPLVELVGGGLRRLVRRWHHLPVRLSAENFSRSAGRAGVTVATITAAFGMAVCMSALVHSFEGAWMGWLRQHFDADLFVGSGSRFRLMAGEPMGAEIAERLERIPGVAAVEPFRVIPARFRDHPVFLQGIALAERTAHGGLAMVEGDLSDALPALRRGSGVLLSDNLAFRFGLHRGDEVAVPTPTGPRTFRVEGTFVDFLGSLDLGTIAVAREQLDAIWHDRSSNLFRLWLAPGTSVSAGRGAVLTALGPGYYAITSRQFLAAVQAVLQRFFVATWALVFVAALVGVIGVANAQLATVVDRAPEIAMLRTIGVSRQDIGRAVVLECGALGALGGAFGLALGGMLAFQFVVVSLRLLTGWRIPFSLPPGFLVMGIVTAALVSALAGYLPARMVARLDERQRSVD